ncbi:MAG TPA: hypothetical protein VMR54_00055 [Thermoanaerobaculia bacterium]|nr:hypothetical protein [Thermoanaerobaculia bacterium]
MADLGDRCAVCGSNLGYTIPRCRFCRKSVCNSCSIRMGGNVFCSRACSHNFLFGGDEDVDDAVREEE